MGEAGRRVGYVRVSTDEQNLGLQLDALRAAGCKPRDTYKDTASRATPSWCGGLTGWAGR